MASAASKVPIELHFGCEKANICELEDEISQAIVVILSPDFLQHKV